MVILSEYVCYAFADKSSHSCGFLRNEEYRMCYDVL